MRHLVGPLTIVLLVASACGGQEHSEASDRPGLAEALQSTSEFQRVRLQDGKLTYQEYESAVLATVQCLRDRGVVISVEPRRASGNVLEFAYSSTDDTDSAASSAYETCYHEHQNLIDIVWYQQNQPSEETVQTARHALANCLREAGLDVTANPTPDDFRRLAMSGSPAFYDCQQEVNTEFDLPSGSIG